MTAVVKKLLQKLPDQRILTCFNHRNPSTFLPPPILQQSKFDTHNHLVNPDSGCLMGVESTHKNAIQFYPSFSFVNFLNPVSPAGFCQSQLLEQRLEPDERIMWADSVKKKRKRKMNKHKLRKLRKRLRGHS